MSTKRSRHPIAEIPPVEKVLNALRKESDDALRRLAERIRARDIPVDLEAANEVKRSGWTPHT